MLKGLFKKTDFTELLANGAIILDVRNEPELEKGFIPGSEHMPMPSVSGRIDEIKAWNKPVICVCASGVRSGMISRLLKGKGIESYNGGGWAKMIPYLDKE